MCSGTQAQASLKLSLTAEGCSCQMPEVRACVNARAEEQSERFARMGVLMTMLALLLQPLVVLLPRLPPLQLLLLLLLLQLP